MNEFNVLVEKDAWRQEVPSGSLHYYLINGWKMVEYSIMNDDARRVVKDMLKFNIDKNKNALELAEKQHNVQIILAKAKYNVAEDIAKMIVETEMPDLAYSIERYKVFIKTLQENEGADDALVKNERLKKFQQKQKEEAEYKKLMEEFASKGEVNSMVNLSKSKPNNKKFNDGIDI